jgi:hypothetical protein
MEVLYSGVTNGKLAQQHRHEEILKSYEAKKVKITYDSPKARSIEQNSYYWGVVLKMLSEHIHYSVDEVHEICKYKFLGYDLKELDGENIPIMKTTRGLSTVDFMGYLEEIKQWAAGLGLVIPDPNQTEFLEND